MQLDEAGYQDLVGAVCDAALEPALWHDALVRVSDVLSAVGTLYLWFDLRRPERSRHVLGRPDPDQRSGTDATT
jgi:hypothetical protein